MNTTNFIATGWRDMLGKELPLCERCSQPFDNKDCDYCKECEIIVNDEEDYKEHKLR